MGLTFFEYDRALSEVRDDINKFEEDFTRYAEKALTTGSKSLYFDVSSCSLLSNLHYIMSLHELIKGWWERQIERQNDPVCLDLMFSMEWEEITLLLDDASEFLEGMKRSLTASEPNKSSTLKVLPSW